MILTLLHQSCARGWPGSWPAGGRCARRGRGWPRRWWARGPPSWQLGSLRGVSSQPPASSLTSLCPLLPTGHTLQQPGRSCAHARTGRKAASPRAWAQPHCSQQRPSICPLAVTVHLATLRCQPGPVVFSSKNTLLLLWQCPGVGVSWGDGGRGCTAAAGGCRGLYTGTTSGHSPHPPRPHTYSFCEDPSGNITAACISMKLWEWGPLLCSRYVLDMTTSPLPSAARVDTQWWLVKWVVWRRRCLDPIVEDTRY